MRSIRYFGLVLQFALLAEINAGQTSPTRYVHVSVKFAYPNSTDPQVSTRIHGGKYAEEHAFPYMVFILASHTKDLLSQSVTCSASLIHEQWVLTAAHCVMPREKPPSIIVVAGKADLRLYYSARLSVSFDKDINEAFFRLQERRVHRVYVHPDYKSAEHGHDLALLLLDKPFELNDAVKTLPLSQKRMSFQESCTVLGWGLDEYDRQTFRLMFAEPVYAQTPEIGCSYIKHGPLICLQKNGGGICKGDSGSPLVCRGLMWGVASFSVSQSQNPSCLDQEEEYFTQIYPDISWINNVLAGENSGNLPNVKSIGFVLAFVAWLFL